MYAKNKISKDMVPCSNNPIERRTNIRQMSTPFNLELPEDRYPETAILLAAGLGNRLLPFTMTTPKPLLLANGAPVIDYILNALVETRIRDTLVVTNYMESSIVSHIRKEFAEKLNVRFVRQDTLNGSAGALLSAAKALAKKDSRYFLISAADYQMPVNYLEELINFHLVEASDITASLRRISQQKVPESSLVVFGENHRILRVLEKPDSSIYVENPIASSLIFIMTRNMLGYLRKIQPSPRREYELQDVINMMIDEGFLAKGYLQEDLPDWEGKYMTDKHR